MNEIKKQTIDYLKELHFSDKMISDYRFYEKMENENQIKIKNLIEIDFSNLKDNTYESYRDLVVLMAADYRLIILVIIDRLSFMKVNKKNHFDNRELYAEISLHVHAALAHRLGVYAIKTELEEISLYYLNHETYMDIVKALELKKKYRETLINKMVEEIKDELGDIKGRMEIFGRSKSIYSIYNKMVTQNKTIDDLFDLYAIRIICEDVVSCYTILGIIHNNYVPLEGRFKDYIAVKKKNLYQSLHTTVLGVEDKSFEIQIRTFEMDYIAENGIAAHWIYKEGNNNTKDITNQLHLFKDKIYTQDFDEQANEENIFLSRIYTFTPNKKIITLPTGSTIVDFAYSIHSKVAEQMTGAKINGEIAKLNTILNNGDVIEIMTKTNFNAPSKEWLEFAATERARKKINSFLKRQIEFQHQEQITQGKEQLILMLKKLNKNPEILESEQSRVKLLRNFSCKRVSELYLDVYDNNITIDDLSDYFEVKVKEIKLVDVDTSDNDDEIYVVGAEGIKKQIARCCNPIPGDDICGLISNGVGIKIHKSDCPNVVNNPLVHTISARFNENIHQNQKFKTIITVYSEDRNNLLSDIMNTITKQKVTISDVDAKVKDLKSIINLTLYINNLEQLNDVFNSLLNVDSVINVKRVIR